MANRFGTDTDSDNQFLDAYGMDLGIAFVNGFGYLKFHRCPTGTIPSHGYVNSNSSPFLLLTFLMDLCISAPFYDSYISIS